MSQAPIKLSNQSTPPRRVEHSGETVLVSSEKAAWEGISLEHLQLPASDISDLTAVSHHLTVQLGTPKTVELKANGRFNRQQLLPGNVCITPAHHLHAIRWQDDMEVLSMTLDPAFVRQALQESVHPEEVELVMHRGQSDLLIREILLALKVEIEAGCPSGRLYGEAMGTALAVHLLKTYTTRKVTPFQFQGGLSRHKLTEVLEYIQAHLEQDIRLLDLASLTGMSQYHFCRLFKRSMGVTPHQYVLQQRIERAKQLLKQTDVAIADIALMCGLKNQSQLTTLFRRSVGTTPRSFRTLD